MASSLMNYMQQHQAAVEDFVIWPGPEIHMRVSTYITQSVPPLDFITSVRAFIWHGQDIMQVTTIEAERHLLPGGRRESGETLSQTLHRELLEETGWTIEEEPLMLGSFVLHHLTREPEWNVFPYPAFAQVVYSARAKTHHPEKRVQNDYEEDARFVPLANALALPIRIGERTLLNEAIRLRQNEPHRSALQ